MSVRCSHFSQILNKKNRRDISGGLYRPRFRGVMWELRLKEEDRTVVYKDAIVLRLKALTSVSAFHRVYLRAQETS